MKTNILVEKINKIDKKFGQYGKKDFSFSTKMYQIKKISSAALINPWSAVRRKYFKIYYEVLSFMGIHSEKSASSLLIPLLKPICMNQWNQ